MRVPLLIALFVVVVPGQAAEWGQFESDFDTDTKPWQELQADLPAFPKPDGLMRIDVGPASRNQHFIDFPSVSVGSDGVVRYSMLIRTQGGAENLSFEGMRCSSSERKIYAFGRTSGKEAGQWARNRHAAWAPIKDRDAAGYHRELFASYFCAGGMGEPDLERVRRLLRQGGYRAPD